ncbi:MAG: hypothetical protein SF053_08640 [Bacteroidia bacterium]|nr:hypothetical protein [Bacteroidia bacterium]
MKIKVYLLMAATCWVLWGISSSCQEQKHPGMLFISNFDVDELIKLGYRVVSQSVDSDHFSQRQRLLSDDKYVLDILIYTRGDTVSTIYCFEHDRPTFHSIDIHYHDTVLFERAYKEWTQSNETFSVLDALASNSSTILVQNKRTNRQVTVKKLPRDTVINISHPIEYSND